MPPGSRRPAWRSCGATSPTRARWPRRRAGASSCTTSRSRRATPGPRSSTPSTSRPPGTSCGPPGGPGRASCTAARTGVYGRLEPPARRRGPPHAPGPALPGEQAPGARRSSAASRASRGRPSVIARLSSVYGPGSRRGLEVYRDALGGTLLHHRPVDAARRPRLRRRHRRWAAPCGELRDARAPVYNLAGGAPRPLLRRLRGHRRGRRDAPAPAPTAGACPSGRWPQRSGPRGSAPRSTRRSCTA